MKKIFNSILTIYLIVAITACSGFLDKNPRDVLSDPTVWNSPEAITAYLAKLYDYMQTEDLNYSSISEAAYLSQYTDEAVRSYTWGDPNNVVIPDDVGTWWDYGAVRNVNSFLEKIKTAPIDEQLRDYYTAEARFIRAFYYFSLVKRYGGVPLILEEQQFTGNNMEDLRVPRDTEKKIYDFIRTELDDIVTILPEDWKSTDRFRVTRYGAYALKSRAMLYAASIATYGTVDLNGLVGIPAGDKDFYWEESKKASEAIINSHKFELYEAYDNKADNFQNLFLDKSAHKEAIFTKAFLSPDKAHSFDFYNAPQSFKVDYGCVTNPVLEIVEDYEYIDGTPGKLKINDNLGNPIEYANPLDLFKDKDPRLLATVMVPFSPWQGGTIEIRKGIINGGNVITASNLTDRYGTSPNDITIIGKDGALDVNDPTKTGFYVKKFMTPTGKVEYDRSDTYWMVFRYAEILLNYAEACVELNQDLDKALIQFNLVRDRAGIKELSAINLDVVRKERRVELAFENHRWWDLRRWRIADQVLNNTQFHSLYPYLVWENGKKPSEMKYIFKIEPAPKNTRTFLPKLYYVKIASSQIQTNPNLVQNPLY